MNLLIVTKDSAKVIENCNSLTQAKKAGINVKNEYWDKFSDAKQCLEQAKNFSKNIEIIKL